MKRSLAIWLILVGLSHPGFAATLLREGASVTVQIGPFVDAVDGVTPEAAAATSINNNVQLSKGGNAFDGRDSTTTPTHDTAGFYQLHLNGTDTGVPGELIIQCSDPTTYLPVWHRFMVVPENVYNSLIAGTDKLEVDATLVEGTDATDQIRDAVVDDATRIDASALNTASTAVGINGSGLTEAGGTGDQFTAIPWNLAWDAEVQSEANDALVDNHLDEFIDTGTVTSGGTASEFPASVVGATNQHVGRIIVFDDDTATSALRGQAAVIVSSSTTATPHVAVDPPLQTVPASGDSYKIYPGPGKRYGLRSADSDSTALARTGADSDTLETLSDQIDGLSTGASPVTVGGFNAAGLADLFDTDSGQTYSSAVAGSVVKEIADHATTPSLTAGGIADAVLNEMLSEHPMSGSLSKVLSDVYDFLNGAPAFSEAMNGQGYTTTLASKLDANVDAKISEVPAKMPTVLVNSTIDDTTVLVTQITFALADGPPDDDALNGALVIVTDATTSDQKAVGIVKDYDQATKTVTLFADPGGFTFANGDKVDVIASGTHLPLW